MSNFKVGDKVSCTLGVGSKLYGNIVGTEMYQNKMRLYEVQMLNGMRFKVSENPEYELTHYKGELK